MYANFKVQIMDLSKFAGSTQTSVALNYDYLSEDGVSVLVFINTLRSLGLWDVIAETDEKNGVNCVKFTNLNIVKI